MTKPEVIGRADLLDALEDGAVVLTANARLSRTLSAEYERRMIAAGYEAWTTPSLLPLSAWWQERFREAGLHGAAELPRLLGQEQEEQVWASLIRAGRDRLPHGLLRVDATARRARAAWKLLRNWHLDLDDRRFGDNENCEAFRRWARGFRQECERQNFVADADIPHLLTPLVRQGLVPAPARIFLAGYFELAPAQEALVQALREAGSEVRWAEIEGRAAPAHRLRAEDSWAEMTAAATWARGVLSDSPQARIGIVVPDLAQRRAALSHLLGKTLDPASLLPGTPARPRPWNLSLGGRLADAPVVATALRLLSLAIPPLRTELAGVLLGSPHWGMPKDSAARMAALSRRALLDRRLRSIGDAEISLSSLRFHADRVDENGTPRPWRCENLARRLENLLRLARKWPDRAHSETWAAVFAEWLKSAGWPEGRPLDSTEFQAVESWNDLFTVFSSLRDFAGPLSRQEALSLLQRLAGDTVFQPRAAEAPVQVLGLYEASGQAFDHLWVMGLHDGAWPPAPGPDPFLPLGLQREKGVPHSDPALELEWARRVTAQLRASAAEVIFSYPARDGAEELVCSPLIAGLEQMATADIPRAPGWFERVSASGGLEAAAAPAPIPLARHEAAGGSRVLACQSTCPFRAFAEQRLGARPLDRVAAGLGAKRSGTLLHRVMEMLWREIGTHARLTELDGEALQEQVRTAVEAALEEQRRRNPLTVSARYSAIESGRLQQRVLDWLELERRRAPFRVVGFEQERLFAIGGLQLRVFIDRIDELEDGGRVVIDYKTGRVTPAHWFGERPDDPQLPLYGIASRGTGGDGPQDGALAGVAFAQIRADGVAFNGVVRDASVLPDLPSPRNRALKEAAEQWPQVLDDWSGVLQRLAAEFSAGEARVDPKNGPRTCREHYCELAALCRIHAAEASGEDGGEGGDDE